jgi:hypothetical protein
LLPAWLVGGDRPALRLFSLTIGQVFLGKRTGRCPQLPDLIVPAARPPQLLVWAGEFASGRMAIRIKTTLREKLLAHLQALGPGYVGIAG